MSDILKTISFDHVSIERNGSAIISDVSATLSEQRIGIIGRNGSGKSTLVRSLNGLLPISGGTLRVHGVSSEEGPKRLARVTGFVFQNPDHQLIFPTALEELSFGLRQIGVGKREAKDQGFALLKDHGIEQLAERPVHELSEGQKQLICILAVLIMEPKLLVLDEPFSSLDLRTRAALRRKLDALEQQIVFVSHELDALNDYDKVLWIEEGQVKLSGKPGDVIPAYQRHELFGADFHFAGAAVS
ncbi:Biotin transport ATP-binding protein BioM [Pseudovibrio axinellae]|uniref:Biotin transport ATP-binding protein BioM n=1 Tax=Pseudovibrio axinellae TaxID=989403 RepID=A0A166A3E4_9HYPH|nr:ABC transporter ATP-binding protein [Pseudovibrio axinellae]KZL20586.1 Biotin transport ATP-binding protein BioM [Pseudovibrio axinellae]SER28560.1 biotin transport system ATP-binding protein [Pseudovibrio axinellae]